MRRLGYVAAKRLALETLGWTLVILGVAALFLPGPGLLTLFAGMVVLSQQYEWFEKRVDPVKRLALEGASRGVQTWPRITASVLGVAWLVGLGIVWGEHPPSPGWWPFEPDWWFIGGWGTGGSLIVSGLIGLALIIYSIRRFRGNPYDHEVETERERERHAARHREKEERRRLRHELSSS
ncbi:MAG: PGPGW domain-containing protein [Dietzia sp.]